jgi:hypothetical protein
MEPVYWAFEESSVLVGFFRLDRIMDNVAQEEADGVVCVLSQPICCFRASYHTSKPTVYTQCNRVALSLSKRLTDHLRQ